MSFSYLSHSMRFSTPGDYAVAVRRTLGEQSTNLALQ
jgi:hypothetical protein